MTDINSLFDLTGLVAVVTGGGDGIGKASCEILAAAGASVVVSDIDAVKAQATAEAILEDGGNAVATACNVMQSPDLAALIEFAVNTYGTVNILVNNAGIGGGGRENPFKIDREYVERVYAINLFAPWELCKLAAPHMQKSGYGAVVNITSMSSINKDPNMAIYGSSKAALNHMMANLAYDYGPMGIRVNNVGPGATRTRALASVLTPELEQKMLAHTPIRRLGEVSDIAAAVLYFASPASQWVSGQVLMVNGGGVQTLD
ncbi:MAG: glucose 1-dehydrogenase [Candidatus Amulumruptor caecigallinarius]|nr:glucose 1-dehydrogenase [Candidatus Amulumruptor caecigallinarius]MCM1396184.1 glucose 1-dehydrogenase [Candidatus Amulumruptor caecigallinarius]MCM1453816.1 glucose 1-dehydrogenase [bacterium]